MSLKGFHIVFIIFSTLLALGIGAWCVWVDLFACWASAGLSILLRRKRWKIDRTHGGGDLVSFWSCDVGPGWNRRIQFSSLAAWAHAGRALPRDDRGRA